MVIVAVVGLVAVTGGEEPAVVASPPTTQPIGPAASTTGQPATTRTTTPAPVTVPDLVGKPLAEAMRLLPATVDVTTIDSVDQRATDGTVLAQEPVAGTQLGTTMRLTVARVPVPTYLQDLGTAAGEWDYSGSSGISGDLYPHSVGAKVNRCYSDKSVEYNLSRAYRQLIATVGINDNAEDSGIRVLLDVSIDGRPLYSGTIAYGVPTPLDVDVANGLRLKLRWQTVKGSACYYDNLLVLGNARLLGLPGKTPPTTTTS